MLVFIDETGTDRRDSLRRYGYSLRGKTPRSSKLLCRGKHISAIAIMSCNGMLDVRIEHESVDGDTFIEKYLLPNLLPFDGINSNSVVIMDNASIHHVNGVVSMISEIGALVHPIHPIMHQ